MKTKLIKRFGDAKDILNLCRATVKKENTDKEPSKEFTRKILISEHSPIRTVTYWWRWENIPSWIATHFSRHKWECFISTQRSDRTGVKRDELPQNTLVDFEGQANIQQLIDTARKRLCHCSSKETRKLMEDLKTTLPHEISFVLVPNCIYRGGCPEMNNCGFYAKFLTDTVETVKLYSIEDRYEAYDKYFKKEGVKNYE